MIDRLDAIAVMDTMMDCELLVIIRVPMLLFWKGESVVFLISSFYLYSTMCAVRLDLPL